jgi:hypothetical protein
VLAIPDTVLDELGTAPPFPVGEQIAYAAATTTIDPCAGVPDNPLLANALVSITNLNATAFSDVWYVANYDTTLTNADGTVRRCRRSGSTRSARTRRSSARAGRRTRHLRAGRDLDLHDPGLRERPPAARRR